jgi:rhodanese-related sulfurtransferase
VNIRIDWRLKIVNTVIRKDLKRMLDSDEELILVDVRDPESYFEGHILHSINIPLENIENWAIQFLQKNENIVVYCGSLTCTLSPQAAEKLTRAGFKNVWDYEGGMKDWRDNGGLIETYRRRAVGE